MNSFTLRRLFLPALLFIGLNVKAQDVKTTEGVMVIQQITHKDGSLEIVKKRVAEGEELNQYLNTTTPEDAREVRVHIVTGEGSKIWVTQGENGQNLSIIKKEFSPEDVQKLQQELGAMHDIMHKERAREIENLNFDFKHFGKFDQFESQRPILGIYPDEGSGQGLVVSSLVSQGGAEKAGLQSGDVITSVDGKNTTDSEDLRSVLSNHKVGDQVTVLYLREGQAGQTVVTLGKSQQYAFHFDQKERNPCDVFIGVYTGATGPNGRGMNISGIIDNTPAAAAGLKASDVILAIDDVPVNSYSEVLRERNKHKPGDWFTLRIRRGESEIDVDAQFKACDQEKQPEETVQEEVAPQVTPLPSTPAPEQNNTLQLEEWNAYPNPTFGPVNVQFKGQAVPTDIQISDAYGKVVFRDQQRQFDGLYNKEVNLSGNAPGVYLITVRQGDQLFTEKIVLMPRA